jgi:uncharacterized protein YdeI (YjbR/CyaY-like superfamily)
MKHKFFAKQHEFRKWLEKNYTKETELIVGFYKVGSGKENMTWPQSVDEALCFGWIDGIRKSIDEESYCIRFTPRKPGSNWSAVNIKKVEILTKNGLMKPAGLKIYNNRKEKKSELYSYENKPEKLTAAYEKIFKADKKAWDFFSSQAPSYQKTIFFWILSAKQEKTRVTRLEKVINASSQLMKIF